MRQGGDAKIAAWLERHGHRVTEEAFFVEKALCLRVFRVAMTFLSEEDDRDLRDIKAMSVGLGIIATSILIDLASADVAAKRARQRRRTTVTLAPTRIRTADGWATGGVLDVRF